MVGGRQREVNKVRAARNAEDVDKEHQEPTGAVRGGNPERVRRECVTHSGSTVSLTG